MFVCFCTHCDTSLESRDSTLGGVLEGTLLGEFTPTFAFITAKLKNKTRKTIDRGVRVDMNNATTGSLSLTLLTLVLKPSQWMYYCAPC